MFRFLFLRFSFIFLANVPNFPYWTVWKSSFSFPQSRFMEGSLKIILFSNMNSYHYNRSLCRPFKWKMRRSFSPLPSRASGVCVKWWISKRNSSRSRTQAICPSNNVKTKQYGFFFTGRGNGDMLRLISYLGVRQGGGSEEMKNTECPERCVQKWDSRCGNRIHARVRGFAEVDFWRKNDFYYKRVRWLFQKPTSIL